MPPNPPTSAAYDLEYWTPASYSIVVEVKLFSYVARQLTQTENMYNYMQYMN